MKGTPSTCTEVSRRGGNRCFFNHSNMQEASGVLSMYKGMLFVRLLRVEGIYDLSV